MNTAEMSKTKRKRNACDDLEADKRQKRNDNLSNEQYSKILIMISVLIDLITIFTINNENTKDREIINYLNYLRNKIPMIVTFGAQSSGKSALLNKIFTGLKLKSCNGIGTKCPIEIQAAPTNENKIIVKQMATNTETIVNSLAEAQLYIDSIGGESIQYNYKIIIRANYPSTITIVDLPGCVNDPNSEAYFMYLKNEYLIKPETVILHVVNSAQDPETDISKYYLPIDNKIIKVLTHTDYWKADKTKMEYLYKLDKIMKCTFAIVNNLANETEIINSFEIQKMENELIKGSSKLLEIITREHQEKISAFIPEFKECIKQTKILFDNKFEILGRQKPDMRQIIGEFRIYMSEIIKKEFKKGSILAFKLNGLKTNFTVEKLQSFKSIIPKASNLAEELSGGSLNQIAGTEGWNNIVQNWISKLIEKIKQELVIQYAQYYCNIVLEQSIEVLSKEYKPCTNNAVKKIIKSLRKHNNKMVQDTIDEIIKNLDNIAMQPCNSDTNYVRDYLIDLHVEPVQKVLEYIKEQHNRIEAIDNALANTKKVLETVITENEFNNFYLAKAKNAHIQLLNFWKSKSVYIHDLIIEQLNRYRINFKNLIEKKIQCVTKDQLIEPPDINDQRQLLLNIYDKCDEILELCK